MSVSSRAVFLSYASQDAEAARRICEALRTAGMAAASYQDLVELYPTASSYHFRHALVLLSKHDPMAALEEMGRENNGAYKEVGLPLALDAAGRVEADRRFKSLLRKMNLQN